MLGTLIGTLLPIAAIHAFAAEAGMIAGAILLAAGGVGLLAVNIPLLNAVKRYLAVALFIGAALLAGRFDGYRARAALDASLDLARQVAAEKALVAEKDRQAKATATEIEAANRRAAEARKRSDAMQAEIEAQTKEERDANTCAVDDAFARRVRRLDDAAGRAAKPAAPR